MAIQLLVMPAQPMKCILGTLQDLEQHIITAYGTAESFIRGDLPIPFQCICQGNGAGPTIWVAVSAPLI